MTDGVCPNDFLHDVTVPAKFQGKCIIVCTVVHLSSNWPSAGIQSTLQLKKKEKGVFDWLIQHKSPSYPIAIQSIYLIPLLIALQVKNAKSKQRQTFHSMTTPCASEHHCDMMVQLQRASCHNSFGMFGFSFKLRGH